MTRYVLTPGLDAPDMIHAEPWDTERCPVDEVWHVDITPEQAEAGLSTRQAIACRRCGIANRAEITGKIPVLFGPEAE